MSAFQETKRMAAIQVEVMEHMDPEDASLRPVHFPHSVAYWSIAMQRSLLASLSNESLRGDFESQFQMVQEALSIAFMTGYAFAKAGEEYSNCECGDLTAQSVEELMANAWRHKFSGTDPSGQPPQE